MPSDTAQRGRPIAMILTAVLLLGLPAALPAAAAPADPPPTCATADPKAHCPATTPTCVTPSAGEIRPRTTAPAEKLPGGKPTTGKPATRSTDACPEEKTSGGDDTSWALFGSIAALLLVLLVLLAVAVRRSGTGRHSAHARTHRNDADPMASRTPTAPAHLPGARRTPRPGNLRPATVATDLHPQGYVEIDGCLFRAVWSEPAEPPPGAGDPVEVGRPDPQDETHDQHVLLAFPADLRRRDHAR
ncbi:hypothetical protein [Streptomyces sp. H39-S7]|uniref:hypothetical protein n=1 Tax=Streptomyces sp. H39-S7 TaxID=3004357 RepID=UPI0022B022E5|nr:hypothetical protein [Streptomyces sp. H39-S7]MCZ4121968.1 hypothetical protein [Streptomyces sp. H39-S7]